MSSVKSAIVLCAGRGTRLKPHTDSVPKPLLPVDGKPTMDLVLHALVLAGVEKVVLVTGYLGEQLEAYAAKQTFFAQNNIMCTHQSQLAGTADAATAALQAMPEWFQGSFLLTASDYLVPPNYYADLVNAYTASNKAIAVSVKRVDESEQAMRSSVRFDASGDIAEVVEKPAPGTAPSSLSANLIYILPADIANAVSQVQPSARGEKEVQSAVNDYLRVNGPACGLEQQTPAEWDPSLI